MVDGVDSQYIHVFYPIKHLRNCSFRILLITIHLLVATNILDVHQEAVTNGAKGGLA